MSYPTERDGDVVVNERSHFVAQRTLRDVIGHRPAAATTRDSAVPDTPFAEWLAVPTWREGTDTEGSVFQSMEVLPTGLSGRYALQSLLARGSEADLWRVRRLTDERECVLKIYFYGIRQEAEVLSGIARKSIAHVPEIFEHGESDGRYFEVLEYLSLGSLQDQIRFGPLDQLTGLYLARELADALDALHARDMIGDKIVHGDIKPANVLLRNLAPLDCVLADFGISRLMANSLNAIRRRGHTPHYSAPETQVGFLEAKSDYWSLGITLLESLTGTHPFVGLTSDEVLSRLNKETWLPDMPAQLPSHWQALISGLLQHDPQIRWGGVETQRWLRHAFSEAVSPKLDESLLTSDSHLRSARDLAIYLARHWAEAATWIPDLGHGGWLDDQMNRLAPEIDLGSMRQRTAPSNDIRLLRLIFSLAPDMPPLWKEWSTAQPDVAALCAQSVEGNTEIQVIVREIFDQNVLSEIGSNSVHSRLTELATAWLQAWQSFLDLRKRMLENGAGLDSLPQDDLILASLFLSILRGQPEGMNEYLRSLRLCRPWLIPALNRQRHDHAAALLATLLYPECELSFTEHLLPRTEILLVSMVLGNLQDHQDRQDALRQSWERNLPWLMPAIESSAAAELLEQTTTLVGETVFQRGWNPPVIALSATHYPVQYTICAERLPIANRVRLAWNVSGAAWIYLIGYGHLSRSGVMDRMESESVHYTLLAFNATGLTVARLPTIGFDEPSLRDPVMLCSEMVMVDNLTSDSLPREIAFEPEEPTPPEQVELCSELTLGVDITSIGLPRELVLVDELDFEEFLPSLELSLRETRGLPKEVLLNGRR